MWLWLKTKFALMMVAIGIDWPNMVDGDKLKGKGAVENGGQKTEFDIEGKREKK